MFAQPLLDIAAVTLEPLGVGADRVQSLLQRLVERLGVLVPEERFDRLRVRLGGEGRDGVLDEHAQHPAFGCAQSALRSDNDEKKGWSDSPAREPLFECGKVLLQPLPHFTLRIGVLCEIAHERKHVLEQATPKESVSIPGNVKQAAGKNIPA